jgi:hypothetical protein
MDFEFTNSIKGKENLSKNTVLNAHVHGILKMHFGC